MRILDRHIAERLLIKSIRLGHRSNSFRRNLRQLDAENFTVES